jgi:hypothetical protein
MPSDSRTTRGNHSPPKSQVTIKQGWVELPLDKLEKAPWNYKEDDPGKAKKLTANIKKNGQVQNIIVRDLGNGKFEVCNGNHRLDSFKELKLQKAMTFNLGRCTVAQGKRVAVETNETSFENNPTALAGIIKELGFAADAPYDLAELVETMPYDENEMKGMADLLDFDWNAFDSGKEGAKEGEEDEEDAEGEPGGQSPHPDWQTSVITCPHCNQKINLKDQ